MSEKYYVVSESQLKEHSQAAFNYWEMLHGGKVNNGEDEDFDRYEKSQSACRALHAVYYCDAHDLDGTLLGSLWATKKVDL